FDVYLWAEGSHYRAYEKLGAHLAEENGVAGTRFAVWAPNARRVSVVGDFNGWKPGVHGLHAVNSSGIWEGFVPGVGQGALYKYPLDSHPPASRVATPAPSASASEMRPSTAPGVWALPGSAWGAGEGLARRKHANALDAPMAIYEVHLGSWRRVPHEGNRW